MKIEDYFSKRIWNGWLEWTGYNAEDMPYEYCVNALNQPNVSSCDAESMVKYMEAWRDGYRNGVVDAE